MCWREANPEQARNRSTATGAFGSLGDMKKPAVPMLCAVVFSAALFTLNFNAQDKPAGDQIVIEVPAPVKALIQRETGGAKILEFSRGHEDGRLIYEAAVSMDGREYMVRCDAAGNLRNIELRARDEDRKPLRLDDLPAPIKAAFQKLARGGVILEVEMQTVEYGADVTMNGRKYHIRVNADGHLLKKEPAGE